MTRLESGHRIMDVGSPHGAKSLDVPSQILEEFGLKPGAFNLESSSDEAYMCCGPVSQSVGDVVLKRIFLCFLGIMRNMPFSILIIAELFLRTFLMVLNSMSAQLLRIALGECRGWLISIIKCFAHPLF